jgi:tetratricopeptide (TPR) repeat protein
MARHIALGLVLLLYVGSFARTASYAFVWDDVSEISENPLLRGPFAHGLAATQHEQMGVHYADWLRPAHDSYRPVRYASYRIDAALTGLSPGGMHLHNLVLGLACLAAAFWFLGEWGLSPWLQRFGVGVLALHPLAVEPVAYVSARSDLLAAGFALVSCAALLRSLRAPRRGLTALSLVAFALSLASKEAFLALPLALVAWAHARGLLRPLLPRLVMLVGVAALWWFVRGLFAKAAGGGHALEALGALGPVFAQYLRAFVAPFDCSVARPAAGPDWLVTTALLAGYLALALTALRTPGGTASTWLAPALWFATSLGPSVVATTVTGTASDRYAYLALLTIPLCLGALPRELALRASTRVLLLSTLALWALVCTGVSLAQVPSWQSPRAMYEHAVNSEPRSAAAWYGLGHTIAEKEGCPVAELVFDKVLTLDPQHVRALNNVGVCRLRRGALPEAEQAFKRALKATQGIYPQAWANLGRVHAAQGRREEACADYGRALAIDPGYRSAQTERSALSCP